MKKSATYFNFGFLLTVLVLVVQIILMLVLKLFKYQGPEFLVLGLPPLLIIILGLVWYRHLSSIWYKQERVLLKLEQYLIAIVPLLFFLSSGLAVASRDYWQLDIWYILIAIFLSSYLSLRGLVHSLAVKLKEVYMLNRLLGKSLLYLITCSAAMWYFAYWLLLN